MCCSFQDLDLHCEELIKEEFGAECNFDVHDAVKKLEKLGIIHRVNLLNNFILIRKSTVITSILVSKVESLGQLQQSSWWVCGGG